MNTQEPTPNAAGGASALTDGLGGTVKDLLHNEKVKEALTFEEMRAEIFRLRFHDVMVRQVMNMADMRGLSAEDRYVALTYYALLERSKLKAVILEDAMTRPAPRMVTPNVEFSGGAPLYGAASAGTQGYASDDNNGEVK